MKILATGDLHLTDKKPENRTDDYKSSVLKKLDFIFQTAINEKCKLIVQPGDFFDSPAPSYSLFSEIAKRIRAIHPIWIASIWGQHDLRYRRKENAALKALSIICSDNFLLEFNGIFQNELRIYSAGWGEEIPKLNNRFCSILIIHRTIVNDKLWAGQTEYVQGFDFVKANKFPLIVSGDNHQSFIIDLKSKRLFNCGSLLRSKIDQINHKPFIIIFDTETRQYEQIMIPIEPAEKIFALEKTSKEKELNENLMAFISGLSEHKEVGLKFEDNLNFYMNENNVKQEIRELINEAKVEG